MTIEEMRKEMRREVVPEEVVPQNVINCLIDEEAEPPKLNAFSFLTRLRALGIGSDDFLNLLIGCDAPENVVEKIQQNPAMNLQGLILTLENSELTADDYTRMLLTARQVWERTLTLRLEKSEKISQEVDITESEDDEPVKIYGEEEEQPEAETGYTEEAADDEYDEDMLEMSFTAILEKMNSETSPEEENITDMTEPEETEESEESAELSNEDTPEPSTENENSSELSFEDAFDKIKSEKKTVSEPPEKTEQTEVSPAPELTGELAGSVDTATLIQIDGDMLRENFEKLSDSDEEQTDDIPKTAKQKKATATADETETSDEDSIDTPLPVYHKGAIIGSTVGAAVLIGAGFIIGSFAGNKNAGNLHYASDNYEIFDKIYRNYDKYSGTMPGGELVCEYGDNYTEVFGDLLISGDGVCPNSFSLGSELYSVKEDAISVSIIENGSVTSLDELIPPDNARFVAAFDSNGELYALFSGKQSGYMKVSEGEVKYTVHQDGKLTDYGLYDGELRLGTVYTPEFTRTFRINDEDVYLPKTGTDALKPISAKKIIVSETEGYSYGISAGYSMEDGSMTDVRAIIGDPVAASSDGRFALNGEKGLIVDASGRKPLACETEKLIYAAFGKDICAISDESEPESIKLVDGRLDTVSILTGLKEEIGSMRFIGSTLIILGADNTFSVDCSDISKPVPTIPRSVNGIIVGGSALTCETNGSTIVITRFELDNGTAVKIGEYTKTVAAGQPEAASLGDPRTAIIDGMRSGVAFSYFDGVSVVSEYVVFADGEQPKTVTVYDDKTGFTAAFADGNKIGAVCSEGVKTLQ